VGEFKLQATDEFDGLSAEIGGVMLRALQPEAIISLAPFMDQGSAVSQAMSSMFGIGLPAVGKTNEAKIVRVLWAGHRQWFVLGAADPAVWAKMLVGKAAVTDQSDAWVAFCLTGADAEEVMARLCSLDLKQMEQGQTARAEFAHMMSVITPINGGFEIMVMRSFARTAIHHTTEAMTKLAAQRRL